MWIVKLILIITFLTILYQDYKNRLVYWFLYPLAGILAFTIQTQHNSLTGSLANSAANFVVIITVIIVSYIYSRVIMKKDFINGSIGIGDILLFLFLSLTFATITFIVLFSFSLFFSLILHIILKRKKTDTTVPLAGYISLFYAAVYFISFFIAPAHLYSY